MKAPRRVDEPHVAHGVDRREEVDERSAKNSPDAETIDDDVSIPKHHRRSGRCQQNRANRGERDDAGDQVDHLRRPRPPDRQHEYDRYGGRQRHGEREKADRVHQPTSRLSRSELVVPTWVRRYWTRTPKHATTTRRSKRMTISISSGMPGTR